MLIVHHGRRKQPSWTWWTLWRKMEHIRALENRRPTSASMLRFSYFIQFQSIVIS